MIIFGTVCAGLGISSLVCPANWSFFDKKELISLSVFLKEGNSSFCKAGVNHSHRSFVKERIALVALR